jgi:cation:H+ antiporter
LERKDMTAARMGYDSLAAIVLYVGGLVLLYMLDQRSGAAGS